MANYFTQCSLHSSAEKPADASGAVADVVHVWCASLSRPEECYQRYRDSLSADERQRAERFHFERDRRHFVVGRGILRALLARYLGDEPNSLCFDYGPYGKPALGGAHKNQLRFNLSHSHGLGLYAVAHGREMGIDLEYVRPIAEMEQLAERFFSTQENAILRVVAAEQRALAFFNCWTRKEAFIKACGEGLSMPLNRFTVSLTPGEPARLLSSDDGFQDGSRWCLRELALPAGYVGALVVEGTHCELELRQWEN